MNVKKLNVATLKWLAMATMFVDHLCIMLSRYGMSQTGYYIMRSVGRVAFPIFAFLLVEGFLHTKSFWKYLTRVMVLAIITEPIFDLFMYGRILASGANVVFNFALSLMALFFWAKAENDKVWKKIFAGVFVLIVMAFAWKFHINYSWKCVLIVIFMYGLRYNIALRNLSVALVLITDSSWVGMFALMGLLPISLYNGEGGRFPKWFGYVFYPLHLLVLLVVGGVMNV